MRLNVWNTLIVVAVIRLTAVPTRANPIEFLDRIVGFAEETFENTFERTGRRPKGRRHSVSD